MAFLPQLLVVGLGNLPLPFTRHSVGHFVVDSLASHLRITMSADRRIGGYIGQENVTLQPGATPVSLTLFKSKSLMNISGDSIASALRKTVKSPNSMIVIQDSLSHKILSLSVKFGGSANGHNGIKSVISSLGGEGNFYRFRIGIGRDGSDAAEYVLRLLSTKEREFWGDGGKGLDSILREIHKVALHLQSVATTKTDSGRLQKDKVG